VRRAIVHIGTPRTGTSTLQWVLFRYRAALQQRGILYPDLTPASATDAHLNHQHLGEALDGRRGRRDRADLLGQLDAYLAATDCDVVLLSYEALCLAPERRRIGQILADVFRRRGFAMEVLLTVKPQAEYLHSTYTWRMQFLRESRVFAAYAQAAMRDRRFDYDRLLRPWRAAGADRLYAVPVKDCRSDRPLVERVFAELGLLDRVAGMISAEDLARVENPSPGPVAVEVARRLRLGQVHRALGPRCREATHFIEQTARRQGFDPTQFNGLTDEISRDVAAIWDASNARFAAEVWQIPWSYRVAGRVARACNEIAGDPTAFEPVLEQIRRLTCAEFGVAEHWLGALMSWVRRPPGIGRKRLPPPRWNR
jgi:hypothetical protein